MPGITGNIEFDMLGNRRNFLVQLLDVGLMEVHSRVGNWSDIRGELVLEPDYKKTKNGALEREETPNQIVDIRRRSMRVTAVMVGNLIQKTSLPMSDCLSGVIMF